MTRCQKRAFSQIVKTCAGRGRPENGRNACGEEGTSVPNTFRQTDCIFGGCGDVGASSLTWDPDSGTGLSLIIATERPLERRLTNCHACGVAPRGGLNCLFELATGHFHREPVRTCLANGYSAETQRATCMNGAQTSPVAGAEQKRGHASDSLPGACRSRSALGTQ